MNESTPPRPVTQTPAFKSWFAGSKVVDAQGNPLKVYHGTNQSFEAFAKDRLGGSTQNDAARSGFWFSDSPDVASAYADHAAKNVVHNVEDFDKKNEWFQREIERAERKQNFDRVEKLTIEWEDHDLGGIRAEPKGANVLPVYLKVVNPKKVVVGGNALAANGIRGIDDILQEAKKEGHDGVIFEDIDDVPGTPLANSNHYVVFSANQIKSAIGNNGNFDPEDHRITAAKYRNPPPPRPPVEATPEFKAWFGQSKVVDLDRHPIIVYHGAPDIRFAKELSTAVFQTSEQRYWDQMTEEGKAKHKPAFWFAAHASVARTYADDSRAFDYQNSEPGTLAVYLKIENPYTIDRKGEKWHGTVKWVEEAYAGGHDGIIIKNSVDSYNVGGKPTNVYVVFKSNQIKSADRNTGKFDPEHPSILASKTAKLPDIDTQEIFSGLLRLGDRINDHPHTDQDFRTYLEGAMPKASIKVKLVTKSPVAPRDLADFILSGEYNPDIAALVWVVIGKGIAEFAKNLSPEEFEKQWPPFSKKFTGIVAHEYTHRDQYQAVKRDNKGGVSDDLLAALYKDQGSIDLDTLAGLVKYHSDPMEIAAWARGAVTELRHSGYSDEKILKFLRSSFLTRHMGTDSRSISVYITLAAHMKDKKAAKELMRKFIAEMIKIIPLEHDKPVSKEEKAIDEELSGPPTFKTSADLKIDKSTSKGNLQIDKAASKHNPKVVKRSKALFLQRPK